MKNVFFTICAKNYLAQAITLKESLLHHNPETDFFLFISDLNDDKNVPDFVVELHESWIPKWRQMAFKYSVIEFCTSIKPFCIDKLFNEGYEKVIYLDPDIFVTANLSPIFDMLDDKSVVLSPHYCNIQTHYTGMVVDPDFLWTGIYNLGFLALKNNAITHKITEWWRDRLWHSCYADREDALHVDQKWFDFIPCFFPNDTLITHHMGINAATWNLHERDLEIIDGQYKIRNIDSNELFDLLFFHFSGFKANNPSVLNFRHPRYSVDNFPSFKPLIEQYLEAELRNGYDTFSKMGYSFNAFENGENIMPFHRRLYRKDESELSDNNPFSTDSKVFKTLKANKLLSGVKSTGFKVYNPKEMAKKGKLVGIFEGLLKFTKKTIGVRYYVALIYILRDVLRFENQTFLIKKKR